MDTGSSSEAVFASHAVHIASGSGSMSSVRASASITGVSSTAVVSRFSAIVVTEANAQQSRNKPRKLPRAAMASLVAATSKTPAAAVSSARTRIVARNSRIGRIRRTVADASPDGSSPVATKARPAASSATATKSSTPRRVNPSRASRASLASRASPAGLRHAPARRGNGGSASSGGTGELYSREGARPTGRNATRPCLHRALRSSWQRAVRRYFHVSLVPGRVVP